MKRSLKFLAAVCLIAAHTAGQEFAPTPPGQLLETSPSPTLAPESTPGLPPKPKKRSWFNRMLHPFSSSTRPAPEYKDPRLRGLVLDLETSPQTVKLSEVRQLDVKVTLTNKGKRAVELDFSTDQRIEIHLKDATGTVLTRWSENHAIKPTAGMLLINPSEHAEYNESIATRDLTPNKVFVLEVFFPNYPELRTHQKFLTAP